MLHLSMILAKFANRVKGKEEGAGLAEYALLLFLIAVVSVFALTTLGNTISGVFNQINAKL